MPHTTPIQAVDSIVIEAALSEVWKILTSFNEYPQWWPRSLGLRVLSCPSDLLGAEMQIRPYGGRPFRCRVESIEPMTSIHLRYFGGFIEGTGQWHLVSEGNKTQVSYRLDAVANGWLIAMLAKVISLGKFHSSSMNTVLRNLDQFVRNNVGSQN